AVYARCRHDGRHRMPRRGHEAWPVIGAGDRQHVHVSWSVHDVPVAEIETQQVGVQRLVHGPGMAPRARDPPGGRPTGCDLAAAGAPVPDGRNRYAAYERVLLVENADSGKPEGGVNGGLRVHDPIFPHATDIYATLIRVKRLAAISIK